MPSLFPLCAAGVIPMFPKRLAEGPFSLREGVPCCAMSVGLVLGPGESSSRRRGLPPPPIAAIADMAAWPLLLLHAESPPPMS